MFNIQRDPAKELNIENWMLNITMKYTLEVIGFNIESCILAQSAGARRIELCDNPGDGGTTPSHGFIKAAREKLEIALFPIIRPRGGDFFYSDAEKNFDVHSCSFNIRHPKHFVWMKSFRPAPCQVSNFFLGHSELTKKFLEDMFHVEIFLNSSWDS